MKQPPILSIVHPEPSGGEASVARSLTVLIPAYNEAAGIGAALDDLYGEPRLRGCRVIVIDDGSQDATGEVAARAGATLVRNWTNLGYGASLQRGIRIAATRYVAWFDADGQHSAKDLADMLGKIAASGAHAVIGCRTSGSHSVASRRAGKWVIHRAANAVLGRPVPDVNCGLRVFERSILSRYATLLPNGFSASTTTTLLFLKRNLHVVFHPVHVKARRGTSSVRQWRDGIRTLHSILRIFVLFNPFRFFGGISTILLLLGMGYGTSLALATGRGIPVLAALLVLMGVQVFCLGVLCDQVTAQRLDQLGPVDLDLADPAAGAEDVSAAPAGQQRAA